MRQNLYWMLMKVNGNMYGQLKGIASCREEKLVAREHEDCKCTGSCTVLRWTLTPMIFNKEHQQFRNMLCNAM